ncbi:ATP-binding protein [Nocardioides yefusunii]|uniref:ATP-binding protein n=1 Tax=Nocardioides yefusunii TaxID=2500546 RepID=A0ABW1QYX7_9ACTN|nr:DUF4143 domain-containing protein [Nocardioides yefusunii]
MEYRERVVDGLLARHLVDSAVVVLEGPRGAGASRAAGRVAARTWRLDIDDYARQFVDMAPHLLLEPGGAPGPVLFDEWQEIPRTLARVLSSVDAAPGQVLLAGSETPTEADELLASGAVARVQIRPMSLWESGHSTGAVSLAALFAGNDVDLTAPAPTLDPHQLFERMVVGGWPGLEGLGETKARRWLREYLLILVRDDFPTRGVRRTPDDLRRFLGVLAAGVGTEQKLSAVARDLAAATSTRTPRAETVAEYLTVLRRLLLLEDVPAWTPQLTSAAALRRTPRRFFVDPSFGLAALGLSSAALRRNLTAAAQHFEGLVLRDLRTYADPLGGVVHHLRDNNGRTVDFVVVLPDGSWGGVAVRMNPAGIDDAAKELLWLAGRVDVSVTGQHPAAFMLVVTGAGLVEVRDDGVLVAPVASLRP